MNLTDYGFVIYIFNNKMNYGPRLLQINDLPLILNEFNAPIFIYVAHNSKFVIHAHWNPNILYIDDKYGLMHQFKIAKNQVTSKILCNYFLESTSYILDAKFVQEYNALQMWMNR